MMGQDRYTRLHTSLTGVAPIVLVLLFDGANPTGNLTGPRQNLCDSVAM